MYSSQAHSELTSPLPFSTVKPKSCKKVVWLNAGCCWALGKSQKGAVFTEGGAGDPSLGLRGSGECLAALN